MYIIDKNQQIWPENQEIEPVVVFPANMKSRTKNQEKKTYRFVIKRSITLCNQNIQTISKYGKPNLN